MGAGNLSIIVAVAENNAIGRDNRLLWHISEDLKYFRQITSGHTVIMGRKTFESIGKPLPNRRNIVVSRTLAPQSGITVAPSVTDALQLAATDTEAFVIGGGTIYRDTFPLAQKLYITRVHEPYRGDTFFPAIDAAEWQETSRTDFAGGAQFPHAFSFLVYVRK
jgi:dihydrofolate reductase